MSLSLSATSRFRDEGTERRENSKKDREIAQLNGPHEENEEKENKKRELAEHYQIVGGNSFRPKSKLDKLVRHLSRISTSGVRRRM